MMLHCSHYRFTFCLNKNSFRIRFYFDKNILAIGEVLVDVITKLDPEAQIIGASRLECHCTVMHKNSVSDPPFNHVTPISIFG